MTIVQQTPFVIRSYGGTGAAGYQRIYVALRALLDGFMDLSAPPDMDQFPREWESYRMDAYQFQRIVNEFDAEGEIILDSWDRGLHIDWIFSVVNRPRADLEAQMQTVVAGALGRGQVTNKPHDSPADMLTAFSATAPLVWGHGNAAAFILNQPAVRPAHQFWGEVDAATVGPV